MAPRSAPRAIPRALLCGSSSGFLNSMGVAARRERMMLVSSSKRLMNSGNEEGDMKEANEGGVPVDAMVLAPELLQAGGFYTKRD
jgi:hypothetical protein